MKRGPTTFSLILALIALALFLALGLAAALSLRLGGRMVSSTYSRLVLSSALAADELSARDDAGAAVALAQMRRLGLRFAAGPPPAPRARLIPMVAELGRAIGQLGGNANSVVATQAPDPEIWIKSRRDPQRWIVLEATSYREQLLGRSAIIAVVAGLIALLIAAIAARILTRPLEQLARNANAWLGGASMDDSLSGSPREVRRLVGAIGAASDRLRNAASERELMLAGISHDLRTPLARLRIALELGDAADPQRAAAMVDDLEQLDGALEQCLAFVRDGRDEALRPLDLATVAGQLLALRAKPDDWQLDSAPTLYINVRPTLLRRAIGNLMDNAERYGAAPFRVDLWRDADNVHIVVTDHGPGVPAALLDQLGQPFLRGDSARGGTGSGLGLSIVARSAQMHGGRLILRNGDASGFIAQISLPYA
jgi:two-component system, OmpR family, osmolarity sensor histidine kinase EnvZ